MKTFLALSFLFFLSACELRSIEAQDEARVRKDFSIPDNAKLEYLSNGGNVSGGFMGREGLRITATFFVDSADLPQTITYLKSHGWTSSPLPDIVHQFQDPPSTIVEVEDGLSFCTVWYYGSPLGPGKPGIHRTLPCEKATLNVLPYKDNFDHYRAGVFDSQSGKFSIVAKNYY